MRGIRTAIAGTRDSVEWLTASGRTTPNSCASTALAEVPGIRSPMVRIASMLATVRP